MRNIDFSALLAVLLELRARAAIPGTDFMWSKWDSQGEALHEIDTFIQAAKDETIEHLYELKLLFSPTGSVQELSISNGWEDKFLELSDRFDRAIGES